MSSGATSVSGMARRRRSSRIAARRAVLAIGVLCLLAAVTLTIVAGSPTRLAAGTTIAGAQVGGLELDEATRTLARRSAALQREPVEFVAGGRTFRLTASQLGVRPDWEGAVRTAAAASDGFAPVRGIRRIQTKLFGEDVVPRVDTYPSVVRVHGRPHRSGRRPPRRRCRSQAARPRDRGRSGAHGAPARPSPHHDARRGGAGRARAPRHRAAAVAHDAASRDTG